MGTIFETELAKAKQELADLEKEWDRLDSTGQSELQRQINIKIEKVQKEIEGLEHTINLIKQ